MAALLLVAVMAAQGCGDENGSATGSSGEETQHPATSKVLAFDKAGESAKKYRIAYLTECVGNVYCEARMNGIQAAAKKYDFEYKVFDANFNPQTQLRLVQDAVAEGYDGYLFAPTAGRAGVHNVEALPGSRRASRSCTLDVPMCDDADYTPGVAATVTMAAAGRTSTASRGQRRTQLRGRRARWRRSEALPGSRPVQHLGNADPRRPTQAPTA